MSIPILAVRNMTLNFGGLQAISDLSFDVPAGSISSIIGPNGAGKTTCFNCVTGYYRPDAGSIFFEEKSIGGIPPHEIATLGIARTYQNIRTYSNLTALENILAGQHCRLSSNLFDAIVHTKKHSQEEKSILENAHFIQEFVGLSGQGDNLARNLPYGAQRRLEIGRAIASRPRLLLLDEPSAGMNPAETLEMIHLIRKMRDELGITILIIEHDMSLIMTISEQVTVLDFGKKIAEGTTDQVQNNSRVIEAYLGRSAIKHKTNQKQRKSIDQKNSKD